MKKLFSNKETESSAMMKELKLRTAGKLEALMEDICLSNEEIATIRTAVTLLKGDAES